MASASDVDPRGGWDEAAGRIDSDGGPANPLIAKLLTLIDGSHRRLWLKVPWWDARVPEAKRILEALLRAHDRQVQVRVIVRPDAECQPAIKALREAGVEVKLRRNEHAKELLADEQHLFFSMNLTRKEIRVNHQSGITTADPVKIEHYATLLEADFTQHQKGASEGEELWRDAADVVPAALLPLLPHTRLNPLQSKAVPVVLDTDRHVLVVAPTGAGKTVIGQVAALRAMKIEGRKAAWLVPARALAAEVGRLRQTWQHHAIDVVELTGEENLDSPRLERADMWVTTTEKFEALYRRGSLATSITQIGCLVVDEVHLVGDPTRGPTLEALLARLRMMSDHTRVVALSATATNAADLASWLNAELVHSSWRPTRLTTQIVAYEPGERYADTERAKDDVLTPIVRDFVPEGTTVDDPGSVLVFCGAKRATRELAAQLAGRPAVHDEAALLEACLSTGVGFHYRGGPRSVEVLRRFNNREARILVATSGLSTGVNTPARAVIVRDLTLGIEPIAVSQVQQMFGRAGRAGQESEGWAFLLCPTSEVGLWQQRLFDGYSVTSHIRDRLADAVLAEVLLGGVIDVEQARAWYGQTFAAWQAQRVEDQDGIDSAIALLAEHGLISVTDEGTMSATHLGALTSRLMVEAAAVAALLPALAALPLPPDAAHAEMLLLRLVGTHVAGFAEPPVNPKNYLPLVDEVLGRPATSPTPEVLRSFGADFTFAAARLALDQPQRLKSTQSSMSVLPLRDTVEQLPRYLAWVAALGQLGLHTWAPAVAGDLARRLTWWQLRPAPSRGAGRLLWFIERLLPLEQRREKLQGMWKMALDEGYTTPDRIKGSPVKVPERALARLFEERITLHVAGPVAAERQLNLHIDGCAGARLTVLVGHRGSRTSVVADRHQNGPITCPIPSAAAGVTQLAIETVAYSNGDAGYAAALIDVDLAQGSAPTDPLADARTLAASLPEALNVEATAGALRRLLRPAKIEQENLVRLAAATPEMAQLAAALAGDFGTDHERADRLRTALTALLHSRESGLPPRPPTEVMRTMTASDDERALAGAALAASAGMTSGLAQGKTTRKLYALVQAHQRWYVLQGPPAGANVSLRPLTPPDLPGQLTVLPQLPAKAQPQQPTIPQLSFLEEFLPVG